MSEEIREQIIKAIEDVFVKQTDGVWQMPFTVNHVKDIVRGKKVYPWAHMFDMLLHRARERATAEDMESPFIYLSTLEEIIKELTGE